MRAVGSVLVMALLLVQPASSASYPIAIPFGRSWPISIVVDSARGLAYLDATSGEYPPTGFLFGVINMTMHEVVKVLPLEGVPGQMALDQATGDVYIAGNHSILVYDARSQSIQRRMEVGHLILSMAYDGRASQDVFVTTGNQVYAVDPRTGSVVGNATVGNGANGLALDPSSGKLFVSEYPDAEIFVFNARNLTPVGTVRLPACCAAQMAVSGKTHLLFATTNTQFVYVVNIETNMLLNRVQVAPSIQNSTKLVTIDNGTGRVFVSFTPGGAVVELDGYGNSVVGGFRVSSQVAGMAIDSRTHELYATNYHQVTVFDVSHLRLQVPLLELAAAAAVIAVAVVAFVAVQRTRRRSPVEGWTSAAGPNFGGEDWTS